MYKKVAGVVEANIARLQSHLNTAGTFNLKSGVLNQYMIGGDCMGEFPGALRRAAKALMKGENGVFIRNHGYRLTKVLDTSDFTASTSAHRRYFTEIVNQQAVAPLFEMFFARNSVFYPLVKHLHNSDPSYIARHGLIFSRDVPNLSFTLMYLLSIAMRLPHDDPKRYSAYLLLVKEGIDAKLAFWIVNHWFTPSEWKTWQFMPLHHGSLFTSTGYHAYTRFMKNDSKPSVNMKAFLQDMVVPQRASRRLGLGEIWCDVSRWQAAEALPFRIGLPLKLHELVSRHNLLLMLQANLVEPSWVSENQSATEVALVQEIASRRQFAAAQDELFNQLPI